MNRKIALSLPALLLLLVSCGGEGAPSASASGHSPPATKEEFIETFVATTRSGDVAALRALVHPKCLLHVNERTAVYVSEQLGRDAHLSIPVSHRATTARIAADAELPFQGYFIYPVRPQLELQIDFEDPRRGDVSVLRQLALDDGGWWLVIPIPTDDTLERMRTASESQHRREKRARELLRQLEGPLRSELLALLREGRKIAAIKRYREVSREGLAMAKTVVDLLEADSAAASPRD